MPSWRQYMAIWDTGATGSVVTSKVVSDCGLKPIGMATVHGIGGQQQSNTYLVNVLLRNNAIVQGVRVTEGKIGAQFDVLFGMDIIGMGDFAVTHKDGKTVFSFRIPSVERIDEKRAQVLGYWRV